MLDLDESDIKKQTKTNKPKNFDPDHLSKVQQLTLQQYKKEYKVLYNELSKLGEQRQYLINKKEINLLKNTIKP